MVRPVVPVFFDFACPYSYASRTREKRLAEEPGVEFVHLPWEIHPDVPAAGEADPEAEPTEAMAAFARANGATIPRRPRRFNTRKALMGVIYAQAHGRAEAYLDRVFRAYVHEQQNVAEDSVLQRLAADAGLDAEGFLASVRSGVWTPHLNAVDALAEKLGVESTATYVIDGEAFQGLGDAAALRERLESALR